MDEVGGCQVEHAADGLAAGPLEERRRHLVPVLDRGAHRAGFEHQPQDVGRIGDRVGRAEAGEQVGRAGVDPHDVPAPIHHHCRVRRVLVEDAVQRRHDPIDRRVVEVVFGVDRGEPGGDEQTVAVAQRDVEGGGEAKHHLTAGLGPSGLHEAHVPGGG